MDAVLRLKNISGYVGLSSDLDGTIYMVTSVDHTDNNYKKIVDEIDLDNKLWDIRHPRIDILDHLK